MIHNIIEKHNPFLPSNALIFRECMGLDAPSKVYRATVTRTTNWNSGDTLTASDLNGEFNNLLNATALVNADISGSADIAASKLDSTVVETDTSQTISGAKTLSGITTVTGAVKNTMTTDSDGSTVTFDLNVTNMHEVTLGGNRTMALSNATTDQVFVIRLIQDGTGSRTVTWFTTIDWDGSTEPTLTTAADKIDVFGFICTATNVYDGFIIGQNLG